MRANSNKFSFLYKLSHHIINFVFLNWYVRLKFSPLHETWSKSESKETWKIFVLFSNKRVRASLEVYTISRSHLRSEFEIVVEKMISEEKKRIWIFFTHGMPFLGEHTLHKFYCSKILLYLLNFSSHFLFPFSFFVTFSYHFFSRTNIFVFENMLLIHNKITKYILCIPTRTFKICFSFSTFKLNQIFWTFHHSFHFDGIFSALLKSKQHCMF